MLFGGWKKTKLAAPKSGKDFTDFLNEVMAEIQKRAPTEQDYYWFIIEVYDYLTGLPNTEELLAGFRLHEIEYSGQKSEESYPRKRNEASRYFREDVSSIVRRTYSEKDTSALLTLTYVLILGKNGQLVAGLRKKYAAHYHNNCIQKGSFGSAEEWADVLEDAENQEIRLPPFERFLPWER